MPDVIHLLPDSVANQIAAGEVIQRPASVVKELVENAVDAGATEVSLLVKDAGRTLIQVIDNGKGMSMTDARFAFERHATSKIRKAEDLFGLTTMGFRGEALASIAAVAQVELKTRQADADVGTRLVIAGSAVEEQEQVATAVGSSFAVKNLFFNIPARRKFLKSNSTEWNNIMTEFERLALVNPNVGFKCYHNDTQVHSLQAHNVKQRILGLFGKNIASSLLPVEVSTSLVQISGFVGMPTSSKRRGAHQYFFVNGRYMRHPYFQKAVLFCYEQLIPAGEQPHFFLYLTIDPSTIDVNIHPTKTEIKFENEQPIWQIIAAAVKEALGRYNGVPSIDFDQENAPEIPVPVEGGVSPPKVNVNTMYNPFKVSTSFNPSAGRTVPVTSGWQQVYDDFRNEKVAIQTLPPDEEPGLLEAEKESADLLFGNEDTLASTSLHFALEDVLLLNVRYIIARCGDGFFVVHKQRAHARVLYERFYSSIVERNNESHRLVFPEVIEFTQSEVAVIDEIQEQLFAAGFDISDLGGGSYSLLGVPAGLEAQDTATLLHKVLYSVIETGYNVKENIAQSLALTLSNNMAYPEAKRITEAEAVTLLNQLFSLSSPAITADGRTVIHAMSAEQIQKLFSN